jgi:hypothetical protein
VLPLREPKCHVLQIVPNRATYSAEHAKGAISEIAESASSVFSIPVNSSIPPASTIDWNDSAVDRFDQTRGMKFRTYGQT